VRGVRVTPLAILLLLVFAAAIALIVFGSAGAQVAGWVAAAVVIIALVGGVLLGRSYCASAMTSTWRGRNPQPPEPETLDETPVDEDAWRREREQRQHDTRQR
jgi:thiol:disulfide interchange protein